MKNDIWKMSPFITAVGIIAAMKIHPACRIVGRVRMPGDKSISHRAAIIAALAHGNSKLANFSPGADCAATVTCLKALGVSIQQSGTELHVEGVGRNGLQKANGPLDCGNSGSTMRMLAGVLAGQNFSSILSGDTSLSERPMVRVIEPLEMMGARVLSKSGKPPLTIEGTPNLKPLSYELPVASAQVKSCVLLAALNAEGHTQISEPLGVTRDHTERMLRWFGVPLTTKPDAVAPVISIDGPVDFFARDVCIPGDISSAAYFITAALLIPNSKLTSEDVGLNPTRTGFLAVLSSLGLNLDSRETSEACNEPIGSVHVSGSSRSAATNSSHRARPALAPELVAQLIDELPLLAVVGTQVPGGIEIRNADELRIKESDRIAVTVKNLRAMGATVDEFDDGMKVSPSQLCGAAIESHGDHRIAMAFTVASLLAEGESEIDDTECVGVSFPEFFNLLESVVER